MSSSEPFIPTHLNLRLERYADFFEDFKKKHQDLNLRLEKKQAQCDLAIKKNINLQEKLNSMTLKSNLYFEEKTKNSSLQLQLEAITNELGSQVSICEELRFRLSQSLKQTNKLKTLNDNYFNDLSEANKSAQQLRVLNQEIQASKDKVEHTYLAEIEHYRNLSTQLTEDKINLNIKISKLEFQARSSTTTDSCVNNEATLKNKVHELHREIKALQEELSIALHQ